MKVTDKMARTANAVLFDKYGWERDAGAEREVIEALQAALDAREPDSPRLASRKHWAMKAARNAARAK